MGDRCSGEVVANNGPVPFLMLDSDLVGKPNYFDIWRQKLHPIYEVDPLEDDPSPMEAGEVHLFDMSRENYTLAENSHVASAFIPHATIGYDPARHPIDMGFSIDSPVRRYLSIAFYALLNQLHVLPREDACALSKGFCGLLRGILNPQTPGTSKEQRYRAERHCEMRSYLDRHLSDPELGIDSLCRIFNVSRSSISGSFQPPVSSKVRVPADECTRHAAGRRYDRTAIAAD